MIKKNLKALSIVCLGLLLSCNANNGKPNLNPTAKMKNFPSETMVNKSYHFDWDTFNCHLTLDLSEQRTVYFYHQPKEFRYFGTRLPDNWEQTYYDMFLTNPNDAALLDSLLQALQEKDKALKINNLVSLLTAFVQGGLVYDWVGLNTISDKLKYPYETLFYQKGLCSDKSVLLAKLLIRLGYDAGFFLFPKANHMGVALKVNKNGNFGTSYAYIETTNYASIGYVPKTVGNDQQILDEQPSLVLPTLRGNKAWEEFEPYSTQQQTLTTAYGVDYCCTSAEHRRLLVAMKKMEGQKEVLTKKLKEEGCEDVIPFSKKETCERLIQDYNSLVTQYNQTVQRYNTLQK